MTDQQHPITPPPELVEKWEEDWHHSKVKHIELELYIAVQAAQWGADRELEACVTLVINDWAQRLGYQHYGAELRSARRPKPPSLKEQALSALGRFSVGAHTTADEMNRDFATIRRALEQLND